MEKSVGSVRGQVDHVEDAGEIKRFSQKAIVVGLAVANAVEQCSGHVGDSGVGGVNRVQQRAAEQQRIGVCVNLKEKSQKENHAMRRGLTSNMCW